MLFDCSWKALCVTRSDLGARRCCCLDRVCIPEHKNTCENDPEALCRNVRILHFCSDSCGRSNALLRHKDNRNILTNHRKHQQKRLTGSGALYLCRSCIHGNLKGICRCRCQRVECRSLHSYRETTDICLQLQTGSMKSKHFRECLQDSILVTSI